MSIAETVTAGILSYNRLNDLRTTLDAVLAIEGLRVLVVENASTDGTVEALRGMLDYPTTRKRLRVHFLDVNTGIAARNRMFDLIDTPYLLTLDDDSWPRSGQDVLAMLQCMESDERIASVCAACIHPITRVAETERIERFASTETAAGVFDVVNIAAGGTLLRMKAVRETSGYAEEFFWGREENDLAFQFLQRGWRVVFLPDAVIWHSLSPAGRFTHERLFRITRNSFWLLWKYFPRTVALPASLLYVMRRLLPCMRHPNRLPPVLRGIGAGYGGIFKYPAGHRFSIRESFALRGWFRKLLYE